MAYVAAGQQEKALRAYRMAGQWPMVFAMAGRLGYTDMAVKRLAHEVAEELISSAQAAEAAQVRVTTSLPTHPTPHPNHCKWSLHIQFA